MFVNTQVKSQAKYNNITFVDCCNRTKVELILIVNRELLYKSSVDPYGGEKKIHFYLSRKESIIIAP